MENVEKDAKGVSSHRAEWEVVSLTASTYAAAPNPEGVVSADEKRDEEFEFDENEKPSDPMFMSRHFEFPSIEHENLPIGPNGNEVQNEHGGQDVSPFLEEGESENEVHEENLELESDNPSQGMQRSNKVEQIVVHHMEFGEAKSLQGLRFVGEEGIIHNSSEFSALHDETDTGMSEPCNMSPDTFEVDNPSNTDVDTLLPSDPSKLNNENANDGSGSACEAWWKRQAASLYNHAKDGNTFWSLFVAAALMGLVVLGKRWHRESRQLQKLKLQANINPEMRWIVGPINHFKDILGCARH